MKKQARNRPQEGMESGMMDVEKLINQGNYELKQGNAVRAMEFINMGLAEIADVDPLLFWTPSGKIFSQHFMLMVIDDFYFRIEFGSNRKISIFIKKQMP